MPYQPSLNRNKRPLKAGDLDSRTSDDVYAQYLRNIYEKWARDNHVSMDAFPYPFLMADSHYSDATVGDSGVSFSLKTVQEAYKHSWGEDYLRYLLGHEYHHTQHDQIRAQDATEIGLVGGVIGAIVAGVSALLPFKDKTYSLVVGGLAGIIGGGLKWLHRWRQDEAQADFSGHQMLIAGMDKPQALQALDNVHQGISHMYNLSQEMAIEKMEWLHNYPAREKRQSFPLQVKQELEKRESPAQMQDFFDHTFQEYQRASGLKAFFTGKA